ncbi:antibiotic biosynthesis monooxygenase family protein [Afifella sp. YEN Y35]|uniref:antibiotic biosynthesis monooxygenase family protein n=1 Tax=Afifella sp. YEN Y35 TaxID=3388337 RepID=UPI0039DFF5A3
MYIAMNRFKVKPEAAEDFAEVWRSRDSQLSKVPGFVEFHLLKGPERDDHVLYASHTVWRSYEDFENWTKSEHFRNAHAGAGERKPLYIEHPQFEGFEVLEDVR